MTNCGSVIIIAAQTKCWLWVMFNATVTSAVMLAMGNNGGMEHYVDYKEVTMTAMTGVTVTM
jgi:hypothetical protein